MGAASANLASHQPGYYKHINANTAGVVVTANAGILVKVVINTKGATANVLTLYDNASAASGNVIAVIDTTSLVQTLQFDAIVTSGIFAVLATGTAADITIIWR